MVGLKKIVIIGLLGLTFSYAKGGVDVGKVIQASFSSQSIISKKQFRLTPKARKALQHKAKARLDSDIVRLYTVKRGKMIEGYAVLIVQRVRSKKTAVLYMIDKRQTIKGIEILAFHEPLEYKPNKTWQSVFKGKKRSDNLYAGQGIPTISGATLSARTLCDAARIALSIVEIYK